MQTRTLKIKVNKFDFTKSKIIFNDEFGITIPLDIRILIALYVAKSLISNSSLTHLYDKELSFQNQFPDHLKSYDLKIIEIYQLLRNFQTA